MRDVGMDDVGMNNERRIMAVAAPLGQRRGLRTGMFAALVAAGILVLAACGGGGVGSAGSPSSPTATSTPTEVPSGVDTPATSGDVDAPPAGGFVIDLEIPDLRISTYQGEDILGGTDLLLSDVVGLGKPVVLNFWAALCPPCRAEMPDIQRIHESRGHEVTVLGIDIGPQQFLGSRDEGVELLADLDVHYPAGTTFDDRVVRNFRIVGMPTTFFIFPDGSLLRAWSGLLNEEKINEFIDELVAG